MMLYEHPFYYLLKLEVSSRDTWQLVISVQVNIAESSFNCHCFMINTVNALCFHLLALLTGTFHYFSEECTYSFFDSVFTFLHSLFQKGVNTTSPFDKTGKCSGYTVGQTHSIILLCYEYYVNILSVITLNTQVSFPFLKIATLLGHSELNMIKQYMYMIPHVLK